MSFASGQSHRRFTTIRAIGALILREMSTTYGRSPGGYIWLVVEPIAAIALLSVAFSLAFRAPSLGENFPLFYATAYLPFAFFMELSNKLSNAIRFSKSLLSFPVVTFVDALAARALLSLLINVLVFLLIMAGIIVIFDLSPVIAPFQVINAFAMVVILAGGIGTLNAYLFLTFPVWRRLWNVMTRPLFIVSGIFFLLEDVPQNLQFILLLNPIFHFTAEMRSAFYGIYNPDYITPVYPYAVGAVTLFFGLLLLYRHYDELIWK